MLVEFKPDADFSVERLEDYEIRKCRESYQNFLKSIETGAIYCIGDLSNARLYYNYFYHVCGVRELFVFQNYTLYCFCSTRAHYIAIQKFLLKEQRELTESLQRVAMSLHFVSEKIDSNSLNVRGLL